MSYGDKHYILSVEDPRNKSAIITGVLTFVYTAGTKTLATLYTNDKRGTLANPITRTQFAADDKIDFWCAASSVDLFVNDSKGNEAFLPSITPTDHVVALEQAGIDKHLVVPFSPSDNTEVDTGIDFPYGVEIYRALIEVVTVDATETIDVGLLSSETAGDADGILAAVSVANSGFVKPFVNVDTTTEDYIGTPYYGALMGKGSAGTSAANDFGQAGGAGHIVTGSNAVSLTYTGSSGSDTAAGYIHVWFRHLR